MRLKLLLCILSLLSLTACTTLNLPSAQTQFQPKPWTVRRAELEKIQQWQIAGAFSVQYNQKSNIASYSWQQTGANYQILIQSSLNLYNLKIAGQPGHVTLWEANKKTVTANSAQTLLQQRLGWSLPITNLTYWVRGLPAPGQQHAQFDQFGHLTETQQSGWQVTLSNYATIHSVDLPRTLNIEGHGLRIKIAIKNWRI